MSIAYATIDDCLDIIPSLADISKDSARLEAMLMQSLLDASRLIESDLMTRLDYFAPASETLFTEKKFYHNGTRYVRLQPYVEINYIQDVDAVVIDADEYLLKDIYDPYDPTLYFIKWSYRRCGMNWWAYSPIIISARWGFPCIPPDIKMAVKHMGCLMFFNNSLTRIGQNDNQLDANQEQRLRDTYRRITEAWLNKLFHVKNLGIA